MHQPVAGPVASAPPAAPVAGLFGKLPAHGDFVRRGWPDATVDAIDRWLTETMSAARAATGDEDDFAAWMGSAPLWRGFVPAGRLGPHALHLGVTPSVDRAGRLFPLAAGIAGEADKAWAHASTEGEAVDAAIYDALAGAMDADGLTDAIAASVTPAEDGAAGGEGPGASVWWLDAGGTPQVESEAVDAALLLRLLSEGQA